MIKVLFLGEEGNIHPWYDDVVELLAGRHSISLYDPSGPLDEQFSAVDVIIDQGGSVGSRGMMDLAAGEGARLWQILGTGLDHVDVEYLLSRGLTVANIPGQFSAAALAEHALHLMLAVSKNLHRAESNVRGGIICQPMNSEIGGKTLAIIGLGASGQELARRAACLGMRVLALDNHPPPQSLASELRLDFFGSPADMEKIIKEAHIVSIHVPLTSQTRHMIDRQALSWMKPETILINVARGEIVDEVALVEALQNRQIRGAGLDVFAGEPLDPNHPLLKLDNVYATPHVAGETRETSCRRAQAVVDNTIRVAQGLSPLFQISSCAAGLTDGATPVLR